MTDEKDKKVVPINKKELEKEGAAINKRIAKKIEKELDEALREHVGLPPDDTEELADDFDADDYDDVCKDCRAKEDDDEFPKEWIPSPIAEHEDFPMVLMRAGNYWYVGAWLGPLGEEKEHILGYPLVLAEMVDNTVPGRSQVSLMLNKMFYSLGIHERMTIHYDTMIFLESDKQKDKELARIYGNAVEKLSIESAGLIPATPEDIMNITHSKPRGNA